MVLTAGICDSCGCSSEHLRRVHRGGRSQLCGCCDGWVRMSLRRTRRVPMWIRSSQDLSREDIAEMRERFQRLRGQHATGVGRWAERRMVFEMGFPYLGPLNDRAWDLALSELDLDRSDFTTSDTTLRLPDVTRELAQLEEVGVMHLPSDGRLRLEIAHLLRGDFGLANKR